MSEYTLQWSPSNRESTPLWPNLNQQLPSWTNQQTVCNNTILIFADSMEPGVCPSHGRSLRTGCLYDIMYTIHTWNM